MSIRLNIYSWCPKKPIVYDLNFDFFFCSCVCIIVAVVRDTGKH